MRGDFPLIIRCARLPAVAALWFLCRLEIRVETGADFKSCLSMQKFVRPQELINYKIKKVIINLSRFAMPILAIAINQISTWSQLRLELSFWGAQAGTERCALNLDNSCFSCRMWFTNWRASMDLQSHFRIPVDSIAVDPRVQGSSLPQSCFLNITLPVT